MKKKTTIRIPLEQYAFVEIETQATPDEARDVYDSFKQAFQQGEGLEPKVWRETLDRYLQDGDMEADRYENMTLEQKRVIQEIKRSINRYKNKNQI